MALITSENTRNGWLYMLKEIAAIQEMIKRTEERVAAFETYCENHAIEFDASGKMLWSLDDVGNAAEDIEMDIKNELNRTKSD